MQKILWLVIASAVVIGGYWFIQQGKSGSADMSDLGVYPYVCENSSQFTMSPSADVASIKLTAGAQDMFTGDVNLAKKGSTTGARFEGASARQLHRVCRRR